MIESPAVRPAKADDERNKARMGPEAVRIVMDTFKREGIDLVVTLPEEPTFSLTDAIRNDPYFTAATVTDESTGIAMCAGAALGGRSTVFVTGIAGLLVSTWALAQMGMVFGAPFVIMASYRGDFGDRTGIPGSQLAMFKRVAEPLLTTLNVPYQIVDEESNLEKAIVDAHFACHSYASPIALMLTGNVLW
jgi:sulfopyruvate decarboxylase TPP-binding subunit